MQLEADLNKQIREKLELFESCGVIKWFERLNTGKVKTLYGSWLQLCREGTPDWIVILKNKMDKISVLFIEAKSDSGLKTHREGQDDFMDKYNSDGLKVIRTANIKEIIKFIDDNEGNTDKCFREIDFHMSEMNIIREEDLE
jgi:hypothetical protein